MPRLDMCLFMLLCISKLVAANIVVEEECELIDESEHSLTNQRIEKQVLGKHGKESITSLRVLGNCNGLLTPPQFVISVGFTCFMDYVSVLALVLPCLSLFILVC